MQNTTKMNGYTCFKLDQYFRITTIGIGARIAPGPLPQHLACGSALGVSSPRSKLDPDLFKADESQLLEISHRQRHVNGFARRHHPRAFTTTAMGQSLG
jgi:hypothetical protein